jgi:DNA repair photolyase
MAEYPLLFHLDRKPTVRDVAARVKALGIEGLTEAERRADAATYQEVACRSALNRVTGMPFAWSLNPYRGCTHACHYCYARRYQAHFELDAGDQFSSVILVKVNLVEVLRRELASPAWSREEVAVGAATDPYQPIEGVYKLTRRSLEALAEARTPVGIVTKGPMIVRDIDVLQDLARQAGCTVCLSVPSVDEEAWEKLEPGTAHPMQRLRAVRELTDAGIDAGVLMAPVVPGISSHPRKLEATVRAIADHGAAFVGLNVLFLEGGTREHFLSFLSREYPRLVDGYQELYRRKYAPDAYRKQVRALFDLLKAKYALAPRVRVEPAIAANTAREDGDQDWPAPNPDPRQPEFNW